MPEHERRLFEHAELFWASKQLFDMYNVRNTYFSLTHDVPVAGSLEDFGDLVVGPLQLHRPAHAGAHAWAR